MCLWRWGRWGCILIISSKNRILLEKSLYMHPVACQSWDLWNTIHTDFVPNFDFNSWLYNPTSSFFSISFSSVINLTIILTYDLESKYKDVLRGFWINNVKKGNLFLNRPISKGIFFSPIFKRTCSKSLEHVLLKIGEKKNPLRNS